MSIPTIPFPRGQTRAAAMRAVVLDQYGTADELTVREISRPHRGDGQVMLRVCAAGVNPIDWRIRNGSLRWLLPAKFPLVLGFDVAGEIVEVSASEDSNRRRWKLGDKVYGFLDNRHGGGYAEYAVAGSGVVARKPAGLTFAEAAATPLAALTALQALRDLGQISTGQRVLINGASGGVGTFAVQLAVALGAEVTAVCSTSNFNLVRNLGATRFVDYTTEDFATGDTRYEIVFDAVGKSSYRKCRRVLKSGGHYITTLPTASSLFFSLVSRLFGPRCHIVLVRPRGEDLMELSRMIDAGDVRPVVQDAYSMEEAAAAHKVSEAGHVQGKLVLIVDASE